MATILIVWTAGTGGGKIERICEVEGKKYRLALNVAPVAALSEWKLYEWRRKFWMSMKSKREATLGSEDAAKRWAEELIAADQVKVRAAAEKEAEKQSRLLEKERRLNNY